MAFASYDAYKSAVANNSKIVGKTVNSISLLVGRIGNLLVLGAPSGAAPTTAVVPTNATAGSFGQENGSGTLCVASAHAQFSAATSSGGSYAIIVADILSHQGGLSGTVTTAQTTNLPTAALTRYTDGVGVMMALTIYTQVGTTATTVTASYTNQDGTSGRVSPSVFIGSTNYRNAGQMILLPLQVGDTGVRSVESVTVLATTGTAGNFGVTLFKPLAMICADGNTSMSKDMISGGLLGGLPEIVDDACLVPFVIGTASGFSGSIILNLAEH